MNGDIIRPPRRPNPRPTAEPQSPPPQAAPLRPGPAPRQAEAEQTPPLAPAHWSHAQSTTDLPDILPEPVLEDEPKPRRRRWPWIVFAIVILLVAIVGSAVAWYQNALQPADSGSTELREITIASGSTPQSIAAQLQTEGVIRSSLAFTIYTRLEGVGGSLQAGDFRLSPADPVPTIVEHLMEGKAEHFTITFYPGATLYDPTGIADNRRTDVYTMLRRAGYSDTEVRAGLDKQYNHPLFAGKPIDTSLEGYVFGETYQFDNSATVEQVLAHTFDVFYKRIEATDVLERLVSHDMTLYEALTLASIIEREVSGQLEDQKVVSQIFHKRLAIGEPLGADATFMYAAQQRNVTPTINLDSPYNTRINTGLPPGPISAPSIAALQAALDPADTDYLYFVSGDDGHNHFARTEAEHVKNTRLYCTTLCNEISH